MFVVAHATEGFYEGLHGIESYAAFELPDNVANIELNDVVYEWFTEEASYLVDWVFDMRHDDFDSEEEKEEAWNNDISECALNIAIVPKGLFTSYEEVDEALGNLGYDDFVKTYQCFLQEEV